MHDLSRRQLGVVARRQLDRTGMLPSAIDRRIRLGILQPVHPGVYRLAGAPPDVRGDVLAAVLAVGDDALASHRCALWLHGVWSSPPRRIEVLTAADHRRRLDGVVVHRSRQLDAADRATVGGVPTTSLPRALLDLGAVCPFEVVEQAFQRSLLERRTSMGPVVAILERVGRRGRGGTAALRACVHRSVPDDRLDSELERRLHVLIDRAGLPAPTLQHELRVSTGNVRLDFAWPRARLAVEADGRRWHATTAQFRRGLARSRAVQAEGWRIEPFGWHDVVEDPDLVVQELRALHPLLASAVPARSAVS